MRQYLVYFLVLGLFLATKCELSLKILKCSEGKNYVPVTSSVVEEKVGANFSLLCDLMSSETNDRYYDFQISWVKPSNDVRFWREQDIDDLDNDKKSKKIYSILKQSEVNKAVKKFEPLRFEDKGKYYCVSLKFNLHVVVEVIVRDERPHFEDRRVQDFQETIFCSDQMFQCLNRVCIISHYVCDGKADCKDGSDESMETCHGDPCKDKLQCDGGRCIPTSWCCDRHHDPNCTVTNRPKCCQILSESYEELEYGSSRVTQPHNGARYIFISVCVLSILFVIVLILLVLSKVLIFANKEAGLRNPRNLENIALRNQLRDCPTLIDSHLYEISADCFRLQGCQYILEPRGPAGTAGNQEGCDVSDPLLFPLDCPPRGADEQPPPYVDVVRNLNEPPPPYTSRENLNAPPLFGAT